MKELVLIEIEGNRYGIWKDALHSACFDVLRVHGFPVGNSFVSGVADHEGKMCTFYDLSASLGHGAYDRNLPGRGVLLTEGRRPSGLVFRREVGRVQAARQKVLDLPDFMATSEISTCIMVEGEPALILDIQAMAERVSEGLYAPRHGMMYDNASGGNTPSPGRTRIVLIGGEKYALPSDSVTDAFRVSDGDVHTVPFAPDRIRGMMVRDGRVLGIIDPSNFLGCEPEDEPGMVLAGRHAGWALVVDDVLDEIDVTAGVIHELPALAAGILRHALVIGDEVIPYLDPPQFMYKDAFVHTMAPDFTLESKVSTAFGMGDLAVRVFTIGDIRHAVPDEEIRKTVHSVPFRSVPIGGITVGAAAYDNKLLPVVDLAMCFGMRSPVGGDTQMAVYENGDLRALLLAGKWGEPAVVPRDELAPLPVTLPWPFVYGCATSGGTVLPIMNTAELALHFVPDQLEDWESLSALADEEILEKESKSASAVVEEPVQEQDPENLFAKDDETIEEEQKNASAPVNEEVQEKETVSPYAVAEEEIQEEEPESPTAAVGETIEEEPGSVSYVVDESIQEQESENASVETDKEVQEVESVNASTTVNEEVQEEETVSPYAVAEEEIQEEELESLSAVTEEEIQEEERESPTAVVGETIEEEPGSVSYVVDEAIQAQESESASVVADEEVQEAESVNASATVDEEVQEEETVSPLAVAEEEIQEEELESTSAVAGEEIQEKEPESLSVLADEETQEPEPKSSFAVVDEEIQEEETESASVATDELENASARTSDAEAAAEEESAGPQALEVEPSGVGPHSKEAPKKKDDAEVTASKISSALEEKTGDKEEKIENDVPEPDAIESAIDAASGEYTDNEEVIHRKEPVRPLPYEHPIRPRIRKERSSWPYAVMGLLAVLALVYVMTRGPHQAAPQAVAAKRSAQATHNPMAKTSTRQDVKSPTKPEVKPELSHETKAETTPVANPAIKDQTPAAAEHAKRLLAIEVGTGDKRTVIESAKPLGVPSVLQGTKKDLRYVIKKGDTLWDISKRLTGDPLLFAAIAGDNHIENPDLIFPGQGITLRVADKK